MGKIKRTYRLDEDVVRTLEKYAKESGITNTEALEAAIQNANTKQDNDRVLSLYEKQIEIKDKQIADITAALVSAQKSVEQAHVLHAVDKRELSLESPEQKQTWRQKVQSLFGK